LALIIFIFCNITAQIYILKGIANNGKMAPKTAILHLYNKRNQEKPKKKPINYTMNGSSGKQRNSKHSPIPKLVANPPRAGIQPKNSSIVSKGSSMFSDKKHDNTKYDDRDGQFGMVFGF
jgi:hypothetical protein